MQTFKFELKNLIDYKSKNANNRLRVNNNPKL